MTTDKQQFHKPPYGSYQTTPEITPIHKKEQSRHGNNTTSEAANMNEQRQAINQPNQPKSYASKMKGQPRDKKGSNGSHLNQTKKNNNANTP
jgi:hypothetical protein